MRHIKWHTKISNEPHCEKDQLIQLLIVKHTCDISMPFVKFPCIGKASVSVPATPGDVDEFTAGEEGRPAMRKKGAFINNVISLYFDILSPSTSHNGILLPKLF